jgi:RNA polymerase sigma-70 factor (ECF subfamily)
VNDDFPDDAVLNRLYRYAWHLTGAREDAFDLVHTVLERWYRQGRRDVEDRVAYLIRAIRNQFIDAYRGREQLNWAPLTDDIASIADDLRSLEDLAITRDVLRRLWPLLSLAERELLYFWAVEGYTLTELSQLTDTPRGTLLARLHRLKTRLSALPMAAG